MKKFSYLILLAFVYLLCCSKSCDQGEQSMAARERWAVKEEIKSLSAHFSSDTLSAKTLIAFEETAKIKVSDFCDYFNIINDPKNAEPFRSQAGKIISTIYESDSCKMQFENLSGVKNSVIETRQLTDPTAQPLKIDFSLKVDSVWITKHLSATDANKFEGQLNCHILATSNHPDNKKLNLEGCITIILSKREKQFGNESMSVWNVYLGDIRFKNIGSGKKQ